MNAINLPGIDLKSSRRITLHKTPTEQNGTLGKVALPTMEGVTIEKVENIISLEANGNYTLIHCLDGRQILVCKTLRDMEQVLENNGFFVRVHRSFSINLDRLQKYVKGKGGYVIMEDGAAIDVSTTRKQAFMDALKVYFGYE